MARYIIKGKNSYYDKEDVVFAVKTCKTKTYAMYLLEKTWKAFNDYHRPQPMPIEFDKKKSNNGEKIIARFFMPSSQEEYKTNGLKSTTYEIWRIENAKEDNTEAV